MSNYNTVDAWSFDAIDATPSEVRTARATHTVEVDDIDDCVIFNTPAEDTDCGEAQFFMDSDDTIFDVVAHYKHKLSTI